MGLRACAVGVEGEPVNTPPLTFSSLTMKLFEILSGTTPEDLQHVRRGVQPPTRSMFDTMGLNSNARSAVAQMVGKKDHEHLGAGLTAYVGGSTDPQELDSAWRISNADEATSGYLEAIFNTPEVYGNPFLPRVKAVRKSGGVAWVQSERLVHLPARGSALGEIVDSLTERLFGEEQLSDQDEPESRLYHLCRLIGRLVEPHNTKVHTTNKQLQQAAEFIRTVLVKNSDNHIDIHPGNVMWRITSVGPQLVITDPIINPFE